MSFQRYIHDYYVYQLDYCMYYFMQYIRKERPNADQFPKVDLKLSSQSLVEFNFQKYSKQITQGWEIRPLKQPTTVRSVL